MESVFFKIQNPVFFTCFLVYIFKKKTKNLQFLAVLYDLGITSKRKSDTLVFKISLFLTYFLFLKSPVFERKETFPICISWTFLSSPFIEEQLKIYSS